MTATKIIDVSDIEFAVMGKDQGQIVEYAYAVHPDGLLVCRRSDGSDRSVSYTAAEIDMDGDEDSLRFEPQNGLLPECGEYEDVLAAGSPLAE